MTRKLFFNTNGINAVIIEEHGKLVSTLSLLEWFLQEAIILIILKRKFDPSQKGDVVLAEQIFNLSFARKIDLTQKHGLLSNGLSKKLDTVRRKRNLFIHGIGLASNNGFYLQILGKTEKEPYTKENLSEFRDFVEDVGGNLLDEFESHGFNLAGDPIPKVVVDK